MTAPAASAEFPWALTQRTSFTGPDGDPASSASTPDVTYDARRDRYVVVWASQEPGPDGPEIYGKRISRKHERIEPAFRISDTPGVLDSANPAIAFNPALDEFLVLWESPSTMGGPRQIHGQRVTPGGNETGADDFLVSAPAGSASVPKLAYNTASGTYLAVWQVPGAGEIDGRVLSATGAPAGAIFQISTTGPASAPSVAYDSVNHRFLVAWSSEASAGEREIYTRLYEGNGAALGAQKRISHIGPDGAPAFDALEPSIAFNSATGEYLVVWRGDAAVPHGQFEVYAQRLNAANAEVGADDFRVSTMGPDGSAAYAVGPSPTVEYLSVPNRYLVLWHGDDDTPPLVEGRIEVFGQALNAAGQEVGLDDFPVRNVSSGATIGRAEFPRAAYDPLANQTLVVWQGTGAAGLAPTESEIFSRRVVDDRDGDGVIDGEDLCPTAPRGAFDANGDGCADDSDRDGLLDQGDRCPTVAHGAFDANRDGCPDDSDADGLIDERDLCRATGGGRLDTNHNGCPGPYKSLAGARISSTVTDFGSSVGVERLRVVDLPSKAKVTLRLRCDRGCTIREKRVKKAGRQTISSRRFKNRRLRSGSIIRATLTAPDTIGGVLRYRVHHGELRRMRTTCIPIGSRVARRRCDRGR
jgi:hypothetical protein